MNRAKLADLRAQLVGKPGVIATLLDALLEEQPAPPTSSKAVTWERRLEDGTPVSWHPSRRDAEMVACRGEVIVPLYERPAPPPEGRVVWVVAHEDGWPTNVWDQREDALGNAHWEREHKCNEGVVFRAVLDPEPTS